MSSIKAVRSVSLAIANDSLVVIVDNDRPDASAIIVGAGQSISPEQINFMRLSGRGPINLVLTDSKIDVLSLPMQPRRNQKHASPIFTVSVDCKTDITSGFTSNDIAHTMRSVANPHACASQFTSPGHVMPILAGDTALLSTQNTQKSGENYLNLLPEAGIAACKLAEQEACAVICSIIDDVGNLAKTDKILHFAKQHKLPLIFISDLCTVLYPNVNTNDNNISLNDD